MIFKITRIMVLGVVICCWLVGALPVKALNELPPWKEKLDCNYPQKYKGLEYCMGLEGKARVIVIDLSDPDIRLEYLIASGKDRYGNSGPCKDVNLPQWSTGPGCYDPTNSSYYPVFSLFNAVDALPKVAAVINSDYGAYTSSNPSTRGHGPEGLTIIGGERIDGKNYKDTDDNAVNRPWLAFGMDPVRMELDQWTSDDGSKPDWMYTAVGGAPWLIKDGLVMYDDIKICKGASLHSCQSQVAQTAVGISEDRRWLYFVLITGTDAKGIAEFMDEKLSVGQAIKFDGGGSSQIYYAGLPEPERSYRVEGRYLSHFLGIMAESGSGIVLEEPSPPPDTTEPPADPSEPPSDTDLNWWQKLKKGWNDFWTDAGTWWDGQVQKVTDAIDALDAWLRDLPRRIEEEVFQWFKDWLNQFNPCRSAGMAPVALAIVLYTRRRRL